MVLQKMLKTSTMVKKRGHISIGNDPFGNLTQILHWVQLVMSI